METSKSATYLGIPGYLPAIYRSPANTPRAAVSLPTSAGGVMFCHSGKRAPGWYTDEWLFDVRLKS